MNYKELCSQVCRLATEVGDYLRTEREKIDTLAVETKGIHDYVTQFDKESERRIVRRLKELIPGSGFIAEEGTATHDGSEEYLWIVDPLDGTTNFIHGVHTTCVSIGLQYQSHLVMGVVYELWGQECFYAYEGGDGAFLNGRPIHVSKAATMNDSLIATGFPYTNFDRIKPYMQYLEWTMRHTHGVRRFGSAAADMVYTACGRVDGFYEYGLKPYDVAGGAYILQQAGGKICDFEGGQDWLFGATIIASNAAVHQELVDSLKSLMKPQ